MTNRSSLRRRAMRMSSASAPVIERQASVKYHVNRKKSKLTTCQLRGSLRPGGETAISASPPDRRNIRRRAEGRRRRLSAKALNPPCRNALDETRRHRPSTAVRASADPRPPRLRGGERLGRHAPYLNAATDDGRRPRATRSSRAAMLRRPGRHRPPGDAIDRAPPYGGVSATASRPCARRLADQGSPANNPAARGHRPNGEHRAKRPRPAYTRWHPERQSPPAGVECESARRASSRAAAESQERLVNSRYTGPCVPCPANGTAGPIPPC